MSRKKPAPEQTKSLFRSRWLPLLVFMAAAAVVSVAANKFASKQAKSEVSPAQTSAAVAEQPVKKFTTVQVAGQSVQVGSQTGQIKPMSPQEAQQLADRLKKMLNNSTDDLPQVKHADGSVSMDVSDRFQNIKVIRRNDDGTISESCVDNPQAAGSFFGIDPALMGDRSATGQPVKASRISRSNRSIK